MLYGAGRRSNYELGRNLISEVNGLKKGLGKGLDALISSTNDLDQQKNNILELKINDVEPNSQQPRKVFDQEKLEALAESIRTHGVVQPIIVRKEEDRYILVAGERRWRASKLAGLKTIPVIVKDLSSKENMEIALIENLQREDLNPIEEAEAYQKLLNDHEMTQEDVAKVVGKSRAAIANSVRLLNLSSEIRNMLIDGRLTSGHARTLVTISDEDRRDKLAAEIVEKSLNVREAEKLSSKEEKKPSVKNKDKTSKTIYVQDMEERLQTLYGTKITLTGGKEKGKIVFEFFSMDEFERLIELLTNNSK